LSLLKFSILHKIKNTDIVTKAIKIMHTYIGNTKMFSNIVLKKGITGRKLLSFAIANPINKLLTL
jgi:hypothetical protein